MHNRCKRSSTSFISFPNIQHTHETQTLHCCLHGIYFVKFTIHPCGHTLMIKTKREIHLIILFTLFYNNSRHLLIIRLTCDHTIPFLGTKSYYIVIIFFDAKTVVMVTSTLPVGFNGKISESYICGVLRDLVPFVQFKKREKYPRRSVNFSKVAGLPATLLKLALPHWCFSHF